jgi:hypothetical protein
MKVNLKKLCGKQTVSREDGLVVAKMLLQAMEEEDTITIDFNNILIASVSFFDEAFGKLAFKYSREVLAKKLDFKNMESFDRALLNDILISRYHQKKLEQRQGRGKKLHNLASGL